MSEPNDDNNNYFCPLSLSIPASIWDGMTNIAMLGPADLCQIVADHLSTAASATTKQPQHHYNLLDVALHGAMVGTHHYNTTELDRTQQSTCNNSVITSPYPPRKIPIEFGQHQSSVFSSSISTGNQQHPLLRIHIATSISDLPSTVQSIHHYILVLDVQDVSIQTFLLHQLSLIPPEFVLFQRITVILLVTTNSRSISSKNKNDGVSTSTTTTTTSVQDALSNIQTAFQRRYTTTTTATTTTATNFLKYLPIYTVSCYSLRPTSSSSLSEDMLNKTMHEILHRIKLGCRNNTTNYSTTCGVSPMFFSCIL
jgi:hypothetical protein